MANWCWVKSFGISAALILGIAPVQAPVQAQVDPQVDPLPLPEPLPAEQPLGTPVTPSSPQNPPDTTPISVTEIQVVGSTVFSPEDLAAMVAPYENRTLTLAELQALANQLNQRYLDAGYITTQVRIPEQVLTGGSVMIEILEGTLAEITVDGADRYQAYVTSRLNLAGNPLNQPALEDQLQLLKLEGLFNSVQAELRRGSAPGESRLAVHLEEANPVSAQTFIDNYSPTSVGAVRAGATLGYRSALVPGDNLTAAVSSTTTWGAQVYALGYQVPLSPNNSTLRIGVTYENFRITEQDNPAFALGIRGSTRIYEAAFRYPLIRTPREELGISLGFRHRDGQSVILDQISIPNRTSVFQFAQDYLLRDMSGAWAVRSQFNLGTGLLNATINPDPQADGQFFSWLGQVQRVQVVSPDNLLIVRADVQLAGSSLLGSEQFVIGGGQSVRGYRQNVRTGDSGFRVSVEDRIVISRNTDDSPMLQLVPFMDVGAVWFHDPTTQPTQQNFLWGAGVGLIANPIPGLELRLDLGLPLVRLTETTDRNTGGQLHFSLGYQF